MAEHQKILTCGPELRVAFQGHLVSLCDLLLAKYLITSDNASELKNPAQPEPNRASRMVEFVRNKVKISKDNYYIFVKALQTDHQYRDILKILGEKCPPPTAIPAAAPATSRSTAPVFHHFVETDVIQKHYADLTEAIKGDFHLFGAQLVQHQCSTEGKVQDIVDHLGYSNFQKASKLLNIIASRIKTSASKENARKIFNCLVFVLEFKLKRQGIADAVVATMKKKDPFYVRPSPTFDDECHQRSEEESGQNKDISMMANNSQSTSGTEKTSENYPTQAEDVNASSKMSGLSPPPIVPPQGRSDAAVKQQEAESKDHTDVQDEQQDEQKRPPSKNTSNASLMQRSQNSEDQNDVDPMQATAQPENGDDASNMRPRVEPDSGPRTEKGTATPSIQPECSLEYLDLEDKRGKPKMIAFRDSMSEEDFLEWLKLKGLSGKDRKIIENNGITPIVFAHHFKEGLAELEFTFGGKIILEKLSITVGEACPTRHIKPTTTVSSDQLLTSSELNLLNIVLAKFSPQLKERGLNLDSALCERSVITKEKVVLCLQEIGQDASELAEILRDKGLGKLQEYMFESVYKQALKDEQYHVRLHAFKMILCGVPRSGKSTFWQRIAVKDFKPSVVSASTRGMESHCLSAVESKECAHMQTKVLFDLQLYSETDTSDLDKEALCIYKHILENHKDSGASSKQPGFSSEETIPSDNSLRESDNVAMNEPDVPSHTIVRSKESSRNSYPDQISEEIRRHFEDLNTLLKEKEVDDKAIIGVVKKLCHLIDAGGQRAYLEMLPTLVVGKALYLLFFSYEEFDKELNETVQVEDNPTEVITGTKYKQMDVIMKSLICVSTTTSRCGSSDVPHSSGKASTTKDKSHSGNVALLVGTHADKVSKEEIERVDKLVKEKVEPFLNCGSLVFAKTGTTLPLAVGLEKSDTSTEYSYNPNDYKEVIMKIVDDRLTSPEFHSLPASWYMFSMVLRRLQHAGNSVLKYSHCQEIARELHIDDEQLNGLLHRLQNILGIVLYFPDVEGVKDIVICDPSLIYKGISEIILKSFDKSTADEHYLKLKKHGLFSEKLLKKYSKSEEMEGQLKIDQLIIILKHLGIIAPVSSSESKLVEENCYIIPCRLDDAPPEHLRVRIQNGQACSIVPLRIYFKCGYPPMGGFCYLFTKLINRKGWVPLLPEMFSPNSDMIYFRNKVTFKVNGHYFVTFLSTDKYYEIHILHTSQDFKIGVDGHSICKIVLDAVSDVLSQSNNTCLREYETGCQCQRCEDYDEHGMIFTCDPGDQVTAKCRKDVYETPIIVGEEKQSIVVWFKEPKDCREYCLGEKVELSIIGSDVKFDTDTDKYCYKWLANGDKIIQNQTYNQKTLCIDKFENKHKGIYKCIVSTASGPTLSVSSELHLDLEPHETFHSEMTQRAFMSFLNANGIPYKFCEKLDGIEFTAKDLINNFTSWEKELKKVVSNRVFMKLKDLVCKVSVPEKKENTPPPPLQQSKSGCIWWILILILLLMAICVGVVYTLNSFGVITISGGVSTYKVQDENTIFKDQSCHKIGNLHNLEQAVQRIGNWKGLCRNLGVNEETMEMLEFANDHDLEKKHKCLKAFCDKEQATWTEVIRAVYEFPISNKRVARDIAETYNISIQIFEKFKSDEL